MEQARVDVEDKIGRGLTEYMGEDVTDDPSDWDTKGLSSWAMSQCVRSGNTRRSVRAGEVAWRRYVPRTEAAGTT